MLSARYLPLPYPSYPALCRQDTTCPWSTDYGGNTFDADEIPMTSTTTATDTIQHSNLVTEVHLMSHLVSYPSPLPGTWGKPWGILHSAQDTVDYHNSKQFLHKTHEVVPSSFGNQQGNMRSAQPYHWSTVRDPWVWDRGPGVPGTPGAGWDT